MIKRPNGGRVTLQLEIICILLTYVLYLVYLSFIIKKCAEVFPWGEHVVAQSTSGGEELAVAAGREALEEALEDDELTDTLGFIGGAAAAAATCQTMKTPHCS